MKRNWTSEEDNYILENQGKLTWKEMSKFLDCAIITVQKRAEVLGVKVVYKEKKDWTEEEVKLLREYAKEYGKRPIARMLKKAVATIEAKAEEEGIVLNGFRDPWEPWMIEYVKENINDKSVSQIAAYLGLSTFKVRKKCEELDIEIPTFGWTEEEEQLLLENYDKCHYSELTKIIPNKSKGAILKKARNMNLNVITENYKEFDEEIAEYIKNNWGKLSINEISRRLNIPRNTVFTYRNKLGLPALGQKVKWDEKNIAKLKKLSKEKNLEELAKTFGTSKVAISKVASANHIKLINNRIKWSSDKIDEIKELSHDHTRNEVCILMDINRGTLEKIAKINGITFKKNDEYRWTEEETNILLKIKRANIVMEVPVLMQLIDKTDETIIKRCRELEVPYIPFPRKEWTDDEIKSLIEDSRVLNIKELVLKYNRSTLSISAKLSKNNVKPVSLTDHWSNEEFEKLLQLLSENKTINEIAVQLNRSVAAVETKLKREKITNTSSFYWTKEEEELLEDLWYDHNMPYIKKKINRSTAAIKNKANELGLGGQFLHQDALRIDEIAEVFNINRHEIETTWIILGLPYKTEKVSKYCSYKYVEIDDLFKFLEQNQFLYDGKDFEENILGVEPEWVKQKRKHDYFYGYEYDRASLIKKRLLQQKKYYLELEKERVISQKVLKKDN